MKTLLIIIILITSLFSEDGSVQSTPSEKIQHTTLFGPIKDVDVSSDGKFVVMGSLGGNIFIMNLEDKNNIAVLHTTLDDITSTDLSKDMTMIIAGDLKGQVEIWNLPKKTLVRKIDGHTQEITSVSISDDNSRVMTASRQESTKLWNLQTGQLIITPASVDRGIDLPSSPLYTRFNHVNAFSFMDARRWIDIFDPRTGKSKGKITIFDETLDPNHRYLPSLLSFTNDRAIEFTADGKNIILSTMDEDTLCKDCKKAIDICIKTFDISSNTLKYKIPVKGRIPVLTLSKDGKYGIFIDQYTDKIKITPPKESTLLSSERYREIALLKRFDIDSGKIVDSYVLLDEWTTDRQVRRPGFKYLHEISDGKYITLAHVVDGGIDVWDIKNLNTTGKGE
ncbi:MAG: WD40 repeat domain-containing protein [Sulfuricurvum sp.]|uniref:WD40 repeat domain-containing protein n=1 Tax=Sulfuricurvum sp. TaxID=2025608 RepID=UPI00261285E9|nr:WD40 repeat domain-containing protein [Sulfuricurvum sp.]MDD5159846.1 WD40 repeat domain-containing protein [Sulfuricurvum sp.]